MRKIIFIGQSGDKAVYYNTRTKEALLADKSALLNTEGARRSNRGIAPLIAIFSLLGLLGGFVAIPIFSGFRYNSAMVPVFILCLSFILFGFIWMMEVALYKGVKRARGATKQEFKEAVYSNLFWENFSEKKATFAKMLAFMIVMLLIFMTTIVIFAAAIPGTIDSFNKQEAFDIQIFFSPLAGLFPAVSYLLLFQNNPIRWLLAVRKYEQGKVIFAEENENKDK
ncbi:hypothetical protein [Streptococcus sanguinis]|uniref:Uncharacterized protein n=1 Tax=Streptococcus sanguinis TaxID=1305 RepID=A0A7H8V1J9_STRSA|nr:hypothetical protein [Streptococcus sanguinis]QLB50294.1 hypothetical protein FDP16_07135 [Streptococcus sanguinis]